MSDDNKGSNATPQNNDDVVTAETNTTVNDGHNTVQYDTYKRVLGKLKNTESQFEELNERFKSMEREKLEAEGNKDQLIDSLRKEIMETKTKLKNTVGVVAQSNAMSAIADEAVKAGCNSVDIVQKFLGDQIGGIEFDGEFRPDREQVRALVEDARDKAPVLFGKPAPNTANHNVSAGAVNAPDKDLKKLTKDELYEKLLTLG